MKFSISKLFLIFYETLAKLNRKFNKNKHTTRTVYSIRAKMSTVLRENFENGQIVRNMQKMIKSVENSGKSPFFGGNFSGIERKIKRKDRKIRPGHGKSGAEKRGGKTKRAGKSASAGKRFESQ